MTIGMFLLSLMDAQTTRVTASIYMAVLGIGIGLVMQVLILAVQNSVPQRDLGIATSAASLFRSLGGAFGTAMFGAILRSRLDHFHPAAGTGWRERHRARLPRRQSTGYPRAPRSCSRRCDRGVRALDPFGLPMDGSPGGPRLRDRPGHEGEAPARRGPRRRDRRRPSGSLRVYLTPKLPLGGGAPFGSHRGPPFATGRSGASPRRIRPHV
jgi:hypothetical protein